MGETVRRIGADRIGAAINIHPQGEPVTDPAQAYCLILGPHDAHDWWRDFPGHAGRFYHCPGVPATTPRSCSNTQPHEPHDWTAGFKGEQDRFHCPGIDAAVALGLAESGEPDPFGRDGGDIDEATGEPITADEHDDPEPQLANLSDSLSAFGELGSAISRIAGIVDRMVTTRSLDRDRHVRQMTELGQQLVAVRRDHDTLAARINTQERRVTELEDDEPDDLDTFVASQSSNPYEVLEAYRQGQRDAYRNAAAIVTNVRYLGPAGGTVEEHTVRILNGVRDNLRDTFIDLAEEPS